MATSEYYKLVSSAATALIDADNPLDALAQISRQLDEQCKFDVCTFYDAAQQRFTFCRGLDEAQKVQLQVAHVQNAISAHAAHTRSDCEIEDVQTCTSPDSTIVQQLGLAAYMCFPLLSRGEMLGTLSFGSRESQFIAHETVDLLHTLNTMFGAAFARNQAEAEQHASEDLYRTLFESIDEGVGICEVLFDDEERPVDYRWIDVNSQFEEHTGVVDPIGKTARELVPDLDETWFQIYGNVALTGESIRFENHAPAMGRWFDVFAFRLGKPEKRQVALIFKDTTERKRRELNTQFLAEVNADLASLSDKTEIAESIGTRIATHFSVSRVAFADVVSHDQGLSIFYEYNSTGGPGCRGDHRLADYVSDDYIEELMRGNTNAVTDLYDDPRTSAWASANEGFDIRAQIHAPYISDGQLKFILGIAHHEPRVWRDDEVELLSDVSKRLFLTLERVRAAEAIREASQHKSKFMAMLSHELRNPLASVKNSLYLLSHEGNDDEQSELALSRINRQVGQLSRLVDDLLDFTRISRNKFQLRSQSLDFNELVQRICDDHRTKLHERGVSLDVELSSEVLSVYGDWNRLAQLVGNLLTNAAKYTRPGGSTRVIVGKDADTNEAVLRVADTGIGMTVETLERVFEPFMQADTSLEHAEGGLGLGLPLVKEIVELHRGSVSAHSEGLGKGSTFEVRIPLEATLPVSPPEEALKEQKTRRKVLIIEDNDDVAQSLMALLRIKGHEVEVADCGAKGIEQAQTYKPDFVLCDIGLPGMDGYEVARTISADPSMQSIYLIALTGYAMPEDVQKAKEAGFDLHLAKPPRLDELIDAITRAAT